MNCNGTDILKNVANAVNCTHALVVLLYTNTHDCIYTYTRVLKNTHTQVYEITCTQVHKNACTQMIVTDKYDKMHIHNGYLNCQSRC